VVEAVDVDESVQSEWLVTGPINLKRAVLQARLDRTRRVEFHHFKR
jgi:hypothetical protein